MAKLEFKNKKILVFGGNGFIGSEVCRQLCSHGDEVFIATRGETNEVSTGDSIIIKLPYSKVSFKELLSNNEFDSIIFLSSNPYPALSEKNVQFDLDYTISPFVQLLEAIKETEISTQVWYASSVAVYGSLKKSKFSETDTPSPISSYGISKLCCESYAKLFCEQHNLNIGILRIFSTFGPKLNRQVVYDLYCKLRKNENSVKLFSTPLDARDLTFVEDVASAIIHVDRSLNAKSQIINIGSGQPIKILNVANEISLLVGFKGEVITQDHRVRGFDGASWCADISKLEQSGFEFKYSFEQGLKKTIKTWME